MACLGLVVEVSGLTSVLGSQQRWFAPEDPKEQPGYLFSSGLLFTLPEPSLESWVPSE